MAWKVPDQVSASVTIDALPPASCAAIRLDAARHLGSGPAREGQQQNPARIGAVEDGWATRCASVLVLPEPAPAITSNGPPGSPTPCSDGPALFRIQLRQMRHGHSENRAAYSPCQEARFVFCSQEADPGWPDAKNVNPVQASDRYGGLSKGHDAICLWRQYPRIGRLPARETWCRPARDGRDSQHRGADRFIQIAGARLRVTGAFHAQNFARDSRTGDLGRRLFRAISCWPIRCSTREPRSPRPSATHSICMGCCRRISERSTSRPRAACRCCAASRPTSNAMPSCAICRIPTRRCSSACSCRISRNCCRSSIRQRSPRLPAIQPAVPQAARGCSSACRTRTASSRSWRIHASTGSRRSS